METRKKGITTYKRDKDKVEISGESKQVGRYILIDLLSKHYMWVLPTILLLCIAPQASIVPPLLQLLSKYSSG